MDDVAAHAVVEVDGVLAKAYKAARATARVDDFDIARAVLNGDIAIKVADESASILSIDIGSAGGVDVAVDGEVAESG